MTIIQGSTNQFWFALRNTAGATMNLATTGDGYTIGAATFRDQYGGDLVITPPLTTANGGVSLVYEADANGVYWSGYIAIPASATIGSDNWGDGVWDLEISDGVNVYRIFQGRCTLSPEVST